MHRKIRFKQNERVNATSLEGKSVLGVYRGVRASYGVYVFGIVVGETTEQELHVCSALTLKRIKPPKGALTARPRAGDNLTGRTNNGDLITGQFMNPDGKHSWLRGWKDGTNHLLPKQAYKVLTNTLRSV
jgi:hypothetical protein